MGTTGWISDVSELIAQSPNKLARTPANAPPKPTANGCSCSACISPKNFSGANLPPAVQQRCDTDMRLDSLAANVIQLLFSGPTHVPATSTEIFKYNIGVRKSLAARARYFAYMLRPTDSDFSARSLPPGFGFAYYVMRPFRLLFKTKTT